MLLIRTLGFASRTRTGSGIGSGSRLLVLLLLLLLRYTTGTVDRQKAVKAVELFDQVRAMTWRLLHPRR